MHILLASMLKEFWLLIRDRMGLAIMFFMPVVLAVIITSVQNSAFNLVNNNKISMLVCNKDTGSVSKELITAITELQMFNIIKTNKNIGEEDISKTMKEHNAMVALVIPENFSSQLNQKARTLASKALTNFGIQSDSTLNEINVLPPDLIFHPVLQQSFCKSISGVLLSVMMVIENKLMIASLYQLVNEKPAPEGFEKEMMKGKINFNEHYALINGSRNIPNATQHNIPAWTIFAMFFTVISLGSNIVKEKLSGSFTRLRTFSPNYLIALAAKQLVYIGVVLLQVVIIFSIGVLIFPLINLPELNIPDNIFSLFLVTIICGWCAISYALCIGIFAQTQEQSNGFGAVSVVLLAAIGGIFVPSFAMPGFFSVIMKISPLYWCLESYYSLFLQSAKLSDISSDILILFLITMILQVIAFIGLKRKNLI